MINYCPGCFEKQRKIDELTEEVKRLKSKLNYLQRKEKEGYFGSSTPSSQVPVKTNVSKENQDKRGGAKPGHRGHGRQSFDESGADRVVRVESEVGDRCPRCGGPLEDKGTENHCVIDIPPLKTERILYLLPKRYCLRCQKAYQPPAPGVLPRSLYGNQLVATASTMHYRHGIPMGRIIVEFPYLSFPFRNLHPSSFNCSGVRSHTTVNRDSGFVSVRKTWSRA